MYVTYIGPNNQWKKDNNSNEISSLEHVNIDDEVCGLTLRLGWIYDVLDCIIDTFGNIQF